MYGPGSGLRSLGFRLFDRSGEVATRSAHRLFEGLFENVLTGMHGVFGTRHEEAFAGKTGCIDVRLRGNDHCVRRGNVLRRELILGPD